MSDFKTIKQIMPAPGWRVVYQDGDIETWRPLGCWALIHVAREEAPDYEYVTGIDMLNGDGMVICDQSPNFLRYEFR